VKAVVWKEEGTNGESKKDALNADYINMDGSRGEEGGKQEKRSKRGGSEGGNY
jgi:hypothetical protein